MIGCSFVSVYHVSPSHFEDHLVNVLFGGEQDVLQNVKLQGNNNPKKHIQDPPLGLFVCSLKDNGENWEKSLKGATLPP